MLMRQAFAILFKTDNVQMGHISDQFQNRTANDFHNAIDAFS